jgi:hypothetical protein
VVPEVVAKAQREQDSVLCTHAQVITIRTFKKQTLCGEREALAGRELLLGVRQRHGRGVIRHL